MSYVAVRREKETIMLSRLDGSSLLVPVNINVLKDFGIELGDVLKIKFDDNNSPFKFKKVELRVEFEKLGVHIFYKDIAVIKRIENRYFFESNIFGKINSLDQMDESLIGRSEQVLIGYRKPEHRNDEMPYGWNGSFVVDVESSRPDGQPSSSNYHQRLGEERGDGNVAKQHNGHVGNSSKIKDVAEHTVIGIVVGEIPSFYYVWTRDGFPGRDAQIPRTEGRNLRISQWIRMHLTSKELDIHFPTQISPSTPIFNCSSYTEIEPLLHTFPTPYGKSVMVTIRNFETTPHTGLYYHSDLGYFSDDKNILHSVNGPVEITVVRRRPEQFYGQMLVWFVDNVYRYGSSSSLAVHRSGSRSPNSVERDMRNLNINNNGYVQHKIPHIGNLTRTVVGIVSARSNTVLFVWIKGAVPGQDVIIPTLNLKIADWVNIQVTEHEYEMYLSRPNQERLFLKYESNNRIHKKEPLLVTKENPLNNSIKVEIPKINYSGTLLYHDILGYIKDPSYILKENGQYSITVDRRVPEPSGKYKTVWYLTRANKLTTKKPENRIARVQPKKLTNDMNTLPESETCTGFITNIRVENDGSKKYYCWLIDKHITTCVHNPTKELFQGDFFKSKFKRVSKDKWNHVYDSEMERIERKLDFEKDENSIIITIKANIIISGAKPEIEHEMFGKIIDLFNRLPKCALLEDPMTMKMSVKQQRNDETWFVHKSFP